MSDASNIEWTDATWNPVRGCTKISPGCANCYAETFAERFRGVKDHPYEQGFDLRLVYDKLDAPLRWKKPRKVFVNSMSDLFQDGVPDDFILAVFAVMANAREHTFQVLTKRPERMRSFVSRLTWKIGFGVVTISGQNHMLVDLPILDGEDSWEPIADGPHRPKADPPRTFIPLNIWIGVSVENQHFADERIPLLLDTPAAIRFISAEPLLESVSLYAFLNTGRAQQMPRHSRRSQGRPWARLGNCRRREWPRRAAIRRGVGARDRAAVPTSGRARVRQTDRRRSA